jgi:hypothetical protein
MYAPRDYVTSGYKPSDCRQMFADVTASIVEQTVPLQYDSARSHFYRDKKLDDTYKECKKKR